MVVTGHGSGAQIILCIRSTPHRLAPATAQADQARPWLCAQPHSVTVVASSNDRRPARLFILASL
jgi:hypothetical protein